MEAEKAVWERYRSRFTPPEVDYDDDDDESNNNPPRTSNAPRPGTPTSWNNNNHHPLGVAGTSTAPGTTGDGGGNLFLDKTMLEYSLPATLTVTATTVTAAATTATTVAATTAATTATTATATIAAATTSSSTSTMTPTATPTVTSTMVAATTPNESRVQSPPPPPLSLRGDEKGEEDLKGIGGGGPRAGGGIDKAMKTHHSGKRDRDGNLKHEEGGGEDLVKQEESAPMDATIATVGTATTTANNNNNNNNNSSEAKEGMVQRKRVCRQRGSQPVAREGRKFRSKEREGWHGRNESSSVVYKMGEGLPEIAKRWKEHASSGHENGGAPPTLDVRIPADLATTLNKQVRGSQLWGTDIYTEDSDLVAVLMHMGYYSPTSSPPPSCIIEIRATVQILPPQNGYRSTLRNSVRSRAWGAASGCSYRLERCRIVKDGGGFVELESCLDRVPVVAPTLAPAAMERTMTTRSSSSNSHRQQKYVQEVTIMYNLCNEPWFKYSMSIVADRGLKRSQYTSARLKKGDVLYLETHRTRYELSHDGDKGACNGTTGTSTAQGNEKASKASEKHNGANGHSGDFTEHYKWARCSPPLPLAVVRSKGVPLPADCVEVVEEGLSWEEIRWSPTSVWIRGKEYVLARAQFLTPRLDGLGKCSLG